MPPSRVALLTLALLLPAAARAQPAVTVESAWARATPPRATTGAVYLSLTSPQGDQLTGVSTPAAAEATLHRMTNEDGVMRMREVDGIDLPAGQTVTLAPGSLHIMLTGLKAPLRQGETVPVHLTFRTAPPLDVAARVEAAGASDPRRRDSAARKGQ